LADVVQRRWSMWTFGVVSTIGVGYLPIDFGGGLWEVSIALAIWSLLWKVGVMGGGHWRWAQWFVREWPRPDHFVDCLALFITTLLTFMLLVPGIRLELFGSGQPSPFLLGIVTSSILVQTLAMSLVGVALLCGLLQRSNLFSALVLMYWLVIVAVSFGKGFESTYATLSAIRHLLAAGGLSIAILIVCRRFYRPPWLSLRRKLRLTGKSRLSCDGIRRLIDHSLAVAGGGVLFLTSVVLVRVMLGGGLHGPLPNSFFGRIPIEFSYTLPIVVVVGTALLYAISHRRVALAMIGSSVFLYWVLLALVFLPWASDSTFISSSFVRILQAASIGMSFYGAFWWWFKNRITDQPLDSRWRLLDVHVLLNLVLAFSLPLYTIANYLISPLYIDSVSLSAGSPMGYVSLQNSDKRARYKSRITRPR